MTDLEEYANKHGWDRQEWSGKSSKPLEVWTKEFPDNRRVEVGHDMFTAVVFYHSGKHSLRSRRNGHNDFVSTLDTLIRVDTLEGKPWPQ